MNGPLGGQRLRLGVAALAATVTLGGGALAASTPAMAATTSVHNGTTWVGTDCDLTWLCGAWQVHLQGNYQYNYTQSVFTSVHCWQSNGWGITFKQTWCGGSGNTIGVNWSVTYYYPTCGDYDGVYVCYIDGQTATYYLRFSVSPNGSIHEWSG